jgi:hypothetical protein
MEQEAWALMRQGRLLYAEPPSAAALASAAAAAAARKKSPSKQGGSTKGESKKILSIKGEFKEVKKDENAWRIQRDNAYDTIENLRRQVLRRSQIKHDQQLQESGLAAATVAAVKNAAKADEKYAILYKRHSNSPGFRYMKKFAGRNQGDYGGSVDDDRSVASGTGTANTGTGTARSHAGGGAGPGGLANIESVFPHRYITLVSTATNLKYCHLGVAELTALAAALRTDDVVTDMVISSAGVSDAGLAGLCPAVPSMTSLVYVDLSFNAISDAGCGALAAAMRQTASVRRMTLRGNRIGDGGAALLIGGLCGSASLRILK